MAEIVGLCKDDVKLFGPDQLQTDAPVAFPVSNNTFPSQIGFKLVVAVTPVGTVAVKETVAVACTGPHPPAAAITLVTV